MHVAWQKLYLKRGRQCDSEKIEKPMIKKHWISYSQMNRKRRNSGKRNVVAETSEEQKRVLAATELPWQYEILL